MRNTDRPALVLLILAASFFAWIPQAVAGSGCKGHRDGGPMARIAEHAEAIGLDAAQLDQMQSLVDTTAARRDELHSEIRASSDELHSLMKSDAPDEETVLGLVTSIGNLKTQGRVESTRLRLAFGKIMTSDQREQLRTIGGSRDGRHHGRHHGKHYGNHDRPHGAEDGSACEEGECKHESCGQCKHASCGESSDEAGAECPHAKAAREAAEVR